MDVERALDLQARVAELSLKALAFTPPKRADALLAQFLDAADVASDDPDADKYYIIATALAADLLSSRRPRAAPPRSIVTCAITRQERG